VIFTMPSAGPAEISVFDLCGRRVRRLHAGVLAAGAHGFDWRGIDEAGRAVAAGTYVVRANSDGGARTVKLLLMK
jgi:flagellar hook assembly protein FlgD